MNLLKKLILILFVSTTYGQEYFQAEIDPNKAFGIIDNPRTETDHKGIDFDAEIGVVHNNIGAYVFYGYFHNAYYQNYGAGTDYYFLKSDNLNLGIGAGLSVIMKKIFFEHQSRGWAGFVAWHSRFLGVIWLNDRIGITGTLQYQRRPDIATKGIIEGKAGIRINLIK